MRWGSRRGVLCFFVLVTLILLTGWAGRNASVINDVWIPFRLCVVGLVMLFVGRAPTTRAGRWLVPLYAVSLCASEAVLLVRPYYPWTPLVFDVVLVPLAWAGVFGL